MGFCPGQSFRTIPRLRMTTCLRTGRVLVGKVTALLDGRAQRCEKAGGDGVFLCEGIAVGRAIGLAFILEVAVRVGAGERNVDAATHRHHTRQSR